MPIAACPECKKVECDCGYFEPCPGCERPISPTALICPYCQCKVLEGTPQKTTPKKTPKPIKVPKARKSNAAPEPEEVQPAPRKVIRQQAAPSKTLPAGYDEDDKRYTVSKQQAGVKNAWTHVTDFEFDSLTDAKKMSDKTASDDRPSIVHDRMTSEVVYNTHPVVPSTPEVKKKR